MSKFEKFLSRKMLVALALIVLITANKLMGLGLSTEELTNMVKLALTYIIVEGAADVTGVIKRGDK